MIEGKLLDNQVMQLVENKQQTQNDDLLPLGSRRERCWIDFIDRETVSYSFWLIIP